MICSTRNVRLSVLCQSLFALLFVLLFPLSARSQVWEKNLTSSWRYGEKGSSIAVDNEGNSYVTGTFDYNITFGDFHLVDRGHGDLYLAKFDSTGRALWARSAGGKQQEEGIGLCLDDAGNCYLTGYLESDTVIFEGRDNPFTGGRGMFVAKYTPSGQVEWVTTPFRGAEKGKAIAVDAFGNLSVTGNFSFWGANHEYYLGGAFTAKLTNTGDTLWSRIVPSTCHTSATSGTSVVVDLQGNTYVAGTRQCNSTRVGSIELSDYGDDVFDRLFVVKYDPDGRVVWARAPVSDSFGYLIFRPAIALDNQNNIYVAASMKGKFHWDDVHLSTGPTDEGATFVMKLSNEGQVQWGFTGQKGDHSNTDLVVDCERNIYLSGFSQLEKYNPQSIFQWRLPTSNLSITGLGIDNHGNAYLTGYKYAEGFLAKYKLPGNTLVRMRQPQASGTLVFCKPPAQTTLKAEGNSLVWYGDASLTEKIGEGSSLPVNVTRTDTFYVTQGTGMCRSWPKPVIIKFPDPLQLFQQGKVCEQGPIAVLRVMGDSLTWYSDSTLTYKIGTGPQYRVKENKPDTFYVVQKFASCLTETQRVVLEVQPWTAASVVAHQETLVCSEGDRYQWYLQDTLLAGATGRSYIARQSGTYTVKVFTGPCSAEISYFLYLPPPVSPPVITSMPPLDDNPWLVYPNPTAEMVRIRKPALIKGPFIVTVRDTKGSRVLMTHPLDFGQKEEEEVNLSALPVGVYILEFSDGDHYLLRRRLVKL